MGKGSAPKPTDPLETAAAQTGTNVSTAIANSYLNNVNQVTPDGTLTYYFGDYPGAGGAGSTSATGYSAAPLPEITVNKGTGGKTHPLAEMMAGGRTSALSGILGSKLKGTGDTYSVNGATFNTMAEAEAYRNSLGGGGSSYSNGQFYSYTDPTTGQTYQIPRITAVQTLSEMQQAIKDQSDNAELNLATLANDQSAFLNDYMATPFSYDSGAHEGWALNLYDKLNGAKVAQDQEALRSQLANQGIKIGSTAYDRAMKNLTDSQGTSRDAFLLDSYNTGMQTALTERNQPINEITALLSGSQVSQPSFVNSAQSNIANTDVASIIANADNAAASAYEAQQQGAGSMLSGLGGLMKGAASLYALSDERAKTDKHKIGETDDGLNIYSFKYKGEDKTNIGLMAQEVAKKKPGAVAKRADGLMMVDYGKALA